ncbi:MAG: hypothetical protein ACYTFY_09430, partial [Planctomycetota bacterium]
MKNEKLSWRVVSKYAEGMQPLTARNWNCTPAWSVTSVEKNSAEEIPHPGGDVAPKGSKKYVFKNRHIDPRFHIEYKLPSKDSPRTQTPTEPDPDKSWELLIKWRDIYLAEAGLTLESDSEEIAECLAESFLCDSHFKYKPMCETFQSDPRSLIHPIDGLLYKSWCVGCATAFAALAGSCGFPARNMGVGAHWVCEVQINGKWHFVENTCRHEQNRGLGAFFRSNHMEMCLDPSGDHGAPADVGDYQTSLWRRPNPQYHNFAGGSWQDVVTLRLAANCVKALYPESDCHTVRAEGKNRLPLIRNDGFYFPAVHAELADKIHKVRKKALPDPIYPFDAEKNSKDYLYQELRDGEKMRLSFWLDKDISSVEQVEIVIPVGTSQQSDFSDNAGRSIFVTVNEFRKSCCDSDCWPPEDSG